LSPETVNDLPLHVEKLSDKAIRVWVGDHISSTAVAALNTSKGIVVIDTTESPTLDAKFREVIAREFGRDDFVYLINTHEHADHTTGNGVYADCEIIAHENCAAGMRARRADVQRTLDWYNERIPALKKELQAAEKGSDEQMMIAEELTIREMVRATLQSGEALTFPTKTFTDTLTLDMGNMTLELYAAGGTHTASDIFVFVPEEGLLFTGDMMADKWLTDTPGCLRAFAVRQGTGGDIPLLLRHWSTLIARAGEIDKYVPAHWNGELSTQGFIDRFHYLDMMHGGIAEAAREDKGLDELFAEFDLETRIPGLAGTPGFTEEWVHDGTIVAIWSDLTGAQSGSEALAAMIEEKGPVAAIAEIRAERESDANRFYFLENEINRLGYEYLNEEKYDAAVAVFEANVAWYPDSWNVYDSLGEAYMKSGQLDLAVNHYNRSLELNPENENGRRMLEEMGTVLAQK
jgi:glyoxylase-like metal-dependent hydrolase (beta-lactamase superfamily II)